jgi:uncharacterized membrane protein YbhN (UPF0104 family)
MTRPTWSTAALPPLLRRVLVWLLALTALGFVAHVVPLRDRCDDPGPREPATVSPGPRPPRLAVTRDDSGGCTLLRPGGDLRLAPQACAALVCEPGLVTALASARVAWLVPLLALYFAGTLAWAARWRALLALGGVRAPLLAVWRVTLESQAGGILLPGGVGGDALRVGFGTALGRRGAFVTTSGPPASPASTATVIATVLLDRALGLVTVSIAAATAAWLFARDGEDAGMRAATVVLAALPIAFVGMIVTLRHVNARVRAGARGAGAGDARALDTMGRGGRAPSTLRALAARVVAPVLGYVGGPGAPRAIARAAALSLLVSASQLAVVRGILHALGASPSAEGLVYVGTTMAFMVAVVPGLPGGWGTSDAAFVFFLARAGITPSSALAVSLIYRLFWYGSGGVGALLFLFRGGGRRAGPLERRVSDVPRPGPS